MLASQQIKHRLDCSAMSTCHTHARLCAMVAVASQAHEIPQLALSIACVIEAAYAAMEFLPAWNQTSARQRMFPQDDRE
jgi:hypothetical protein